MKKRFLAIAIALISLTACEDKWEYMEGREPATGGGETPIESTGSYQPLTPGSKWVYTGTENYIVTSLNEETSIGGKSFHAFNNSVSGNFYINVNNGQYTGNGMFDDDIQSLNPFSLIFLKDNQPVNHTWSSTIKLQPEGSPVELNAEYKFTIKEKGIDFKIDNKIYKNVIRVSMVLSLPGYGEISNGSYYYAKNIGFIYSDISANAEKHIVKLSSYEIK
ncbi:hypothetical protein [Solitalea lacus]|uniref:hypothetical protein n=1 Tax=Solitalea lacus TaxID=2911172 RepID=UPI001EDB24CF|nr:hypothetical protein [Solitalea lacus]UKJ07057.1 hypothetical protein L2B55_16195 [Solitalea lacus]